MINSSKSVGVNKLLELIKVYSKNGNKNQSITVGVVGYPNTGKSSLINSMCMK